jgi:hypothetical protein
VPLKTFRTRAAIAAIFLIIAALVADRPASAQEPEPVARVVAQIGPVMAFQGTTPRALHLAAPLFEGDHVVTGPDARVELELADGSRLSLGAGTRVALDQVRYDAGGRGVRGFFNLILGILRSSLSGPTWREGFSIETRAAVASVRSTDFVTEALAEKIAVFVVEGRVEVAAGQTLVATLQAGQGVDVPLGATQAETKTWGQKRVDDVLARTRVR